MTIHIDKMKPQTQDKADEINKAMFNIKKEIAGFNKHGHYPYYQVKIAIDKAVSDERARLRKEIKKKKFFINNFDLEDKNLLEYLKENKIKVGTGDAVWIDDVNELLGNAPQTKPRSDLKAGSQSKRFQEDKIGDTLRGKRGAGEKNV